MNKILSITSLIVGIIGIALYSFPSAEFLCGIGGLILASLAKEENTSKLIEGVRSWGRNIAWINIIWVCLCFCAEWLYILF